MCGSTYVWAVAFICYDVFRFAAPAELRCYKGSMDDYIVAPFSKAAELIGSPCIDVDRPTMFYTFGYRGRVRGPATTAVVSVYLGTGKRNVLLVDWEQEAQSGTLGLQLGSMDDYIVAPFSKAAELIGSPCIDVDRPTMFYTFGYRGRVRGPATTAVVSAYLGTGKRNVLLVDWEQEAQSGTLGLQLGYALSAVPNAKKVGDELGLALVSLARAGLNMTRMQLVGHSLGAHLMCYAGRAARLQRYTVPRLIALDPARALFEGRFSWNQGVDRTCAKFVEVIHTDPGNYGMKFPMGTADFFPNFAGYDGQTVQPPCKAGDFDMFSAEDLCNHDCSWRYLNASISQPTAFVAVRADSYEQWVARDFNASDIAYMGELTSDSARGSYFLRTTGTPPFGLFREGRYPREPASTGGRRRRTPALRGLQTLLRWLR